MIEYKNKVFIGNWREINSTEYQYGSIEINSNSDSKLSVLGIFPNKWYDRNNFPETIVGNFFETESRNCFTIILHKSIGSGRSMSTMSNYYFIYQFTLVGDKAVEGSIQNLHFNEIMVSSDSFQKTVTTDDIEIIHDSIEDPILYKAKYADPYEIYKDDFQKVYLWWRSTFPLSNSHKMVLDRPGWLNINFNESMNLESCLNQKSKIEQLLTFLSKRNVSFDYFDIHHMCGQTFTFLGLKKGYDIGINQQCLNILFNNPVQSYSQWLSIFEKIGFATETFHNAFIDMELSIENKFLSFCFSLELFHREFYSKFEPLAKRNSEIIKKIALTLKGRGELETWFNKVATSTREVHFKNRISDLLRDSNLDLNIDFEEYAERIKDTRNMLVHLEDSQKNPFSKEEMVQNLKIISDLFIDHLNKKITSSEAENNHDKIKLDV